MKKVQLGLVRGLTISMAESPLVDLLCLYQKLGSKTPPARAVRRKVDVEWM